MRHTACMVVVAVMLVSAVGLANGDEDAPTPAQLEQYEKGLAISARQAELEHQQSLRELELEERRIEIDRKRQSFAGRHKDNGGGVVLLLILVVHILVTIWVCKDMREQKIARALWVPIVLLTGVFGAILYAIVRNADVRRKPQAPAGE